MYKDYSISNLDRNMNAMLYNNVPVQNIPQNKTTSVIPDSYSFTSNAPVKPELTPKQEDKPNSAKGIITAAVAVIATGIATVIAVKHGVTPTKLVKAAKTGFQNLMPKIKLMATNAKESASKALVLYKEHWPAIKKP